MYFLHNKLLGLVRLRFLRWHYTGGASAMAAQNDFHNKHGFYITSADYIIRPEVLESKFLRLARVPWCLERAKEALAINSLGCTIADSKSVDMQV